MKQQKKWAGRGALRGARVFWRPRSPAPQPAQSAQQAPKKSKMSAARNAAIAAGVVGAGYAVRDAAEYNTANPGKKLTAAEVAVMMLTRGGAAASAACTFAGSDGSLLERAVKGVAAGAVVGLGSIGSINKLSGDAATRVGNKVYPGQVWPQWTPGEDAEKKQSYKKGKKLGAPSFGRAAESRPYL
jgi:hypothetical protein